MTRRQRILVAILCLGLVVLIALRDAPAGRDTTIPSPALAAHPPTRHLAPGPPPAPIIDRLEPWAQALAYAGQLADDRNPAAPTEPAARALAQQAAAVVAAQPWSDWRDLPGAAGSAASEPGAARMVQPLDPDPQAARPRAGGGGLQLTADAATSLRLAPTGADPFVFQAPDRALVIRVAAGSGRGLRLDGGLLVPGRFYLLRRRSELRTALPLGIEIRPATAVERFHPEPIAPPPGDG